jgi:hypothetical protein
MFPWKHAKEPFNKILGTGRVMTVFLFQEIDVEVELTANHWGRFEMYLCPNNNPRYEATQSCFDRFVFVAAGTAFVSLNSSHYLLFPVDGVRKL